jgi:hypothetical protein
VQTSVASAHPPTLVILGVDASGKNHIANLAADLLAARGHPAAKRSGWLAAHPRQVASSQDKGCVRRLEEWLFVTAYPLHRVLLPRLVDLAVRADLRLANRLGRRVGPGTILISHTPLRVLAFHVGHGGSIPGYLDARLRRLGERAGGRAVVLDIAHETRLARVADRAAHGRLRPLLDRPDPTEETDLTERP